MDRKYGTSNSSSPGKEVHVWIWWVQLGGGDGRSPGSIGIPGMIYHIGSLGLKYVLEGEVYLQ